MENFRLFVPLIGVPACTIYLVSILLKFKKGTMAPKEKRLALFAVLILLWNVYELYRDFYLIKDTLVQMLG